MAYATIARADVIVSWNFKHPVNPSRARAFNGVNISRAYGQIIIMAPADIMELLEENDEEEKLDCVEMKRRIQEKVFEETRDMRHDELARSYHGRIAKSQFSSFLDIPASHRNTGAGVISWNSFDRSIR